MNSKIKLIIAIGSLVIVSLVLGVSFFVASNRGKAVGGKLAAIDAKINEIETEKRQLEADLNGKNQELDRVKKEIESLSYPKRLKESLISVQEMVRNLNDELKNLRRQNNTLQGDNIVKEKRLWNYTKRIEKLVDEVKENKSKAVKLQQALNRANKELSSETSARFGRASSPVRGSRALKELQEQYQAIEREKNLLREQLAKTERVQQRRPIQQNTGLFSKYKTAISDKNTEIRKLKQELVNLEYLEQREEELLKLKDGLQVQITELSDEVQVKEGKINKLQSVFEQVKVEGTQKIETLSKQLGSLKSSYDSIQSERDFLQLKKEELSGVNLGLQERVSGLFMALKDKEGEMVELRKNFEQVKLIGKEKIKNLNLILKTLEGRYRNIEDERNILRVKQEKLGSVNSELEKKIFEITFMLKNKKEEITRISQDLKETKLSGERKVVQITGDLENIQGKYNILQHKISGLKLKETAFNTRNSQLEKGMRELTDVLNIKENEISLLKEQYSQTKDADTQKLTVLSKQLSKISDDYAKMKSERNVLKKNSNGLTGLNDKLKYQIGELFTKLKNREFQIADLKYDFEQARTLGVERVTAIAGELKEMQMKYIEFEKAKLDLRYREEQLRGENTTLQNEVFELSETLKNKESEIRYLKDSFLKVKNVDADKVFSLTRELRALKERYVSIDDERKTSSLKQGAISNLNYNLKKQIAVLAEKLITKRNEIDQLREASKKSKFSNSRRLKIAEEALIKLKKRYASLEKERRSLKKKEQEFNIFNTNLQKQVMKLSSELNDKTRFLKEVRQEIDSQRKNSVDTADYGNLKKRVRTQNDELSKVNDLYGRLKNQLQKIGSQLSEKENKLSKKERETNILRDDLSHLKSNVNYWDTISLDVRSQQENLLSELSRALDLNVKLQKQLDESSSYDSGPVYDSGDVDTFSANLGKDYLYSSYDEKDDYKARVDKLKKQVEVILQRVEGTRR